MVHSPQAAQHSIPGHVPSSKRLVCLEGWSGKPVACSQVLQSLPRATPDMLASFHASFQAAAAGRHPEKDQRNLVKELLRMAGKQGLESAMKVFSACLWLAVLPCCRPVPIQLLCCVPGQLALSTCTV